MAYNDRELDSMPFGKHRGVPIEQVPYDYLAWAVDNIDPNDKPDVYALCEAELIRRKNAGQV